MDEAELKKYLSAIKSLDPAAQAELARLLDQLEGARAKTSAQTDFMAFTRRIWPDFIEGSHHKIMADAFNRIVDGKLKRLIVNMPPRHTKSEFASYLLPGWFLGRFPKKKVIQATHTAELSQGFGRKVRNLIQDDKAYREIFPNVRLRADSTAAGRWNTSEGGEYFAVGVGANIAGKGADLFVIDDPHSEQDAISGESDPAVWEKAYEWYTSGPRQRLQPGGAIVLVMTRWSQRDLTARVLAEAERRGEMSEWEVIEFPAILPADNPQGEKPLWPEFWSYKEMCKLRKELPPQKWAAQYMQNPSAGSAQLVKEGWWRLWEHKEPPKVTLVIQSWDTAFSTSTRADFSACTTWGVFLAPDARGREIPQLILLDSFRDRLEFPALKAKAAELYRRYEPDICIIEASAAGTPLAYELRSAGIPVSEYVPGRRGGDKILRLNSVTDMFASGMIWHMPTPGNAETIAEFSTFPVGDHDDLVDSGVQALLRYRQGGLIRLSSDEDEEEEEKTRRKRRTYYNVL